MAQNFDVEEVVVAPFSGVIERTGKLAFKHTTNLSFKSQGYLSYLSVDEGDYFEKGTLLASLDVAELKAHKNGAYAQLLAAKRDVDRVNELIKRKLSSAQALDIAETKVETTRAQYKVAFYNLEKAQVQAPFSGVVLKRMTELGELQSPGKEILTVAELENNWVIKVALTEMEIAQVRLHQKVEVRLNRLGKIEGVVSKIPAIASSVGQLFQIEISLPQMPKTERIIAGQMAQININFTDEHLVYRIPIDALIGVDNSGRALIMTQRANAKEFEQQTFEIHKLDNHYVYLLANIDSPPLQIVTRGWQQLSIQK